MIQKYKKQKPVPTNCIFCHEKKEPDYKDLDLLGKYISERGKIIGKDRSGVCAKHGRRVSLSIKHARYIGLVPFVARPH